MEKLVIFKNADKEGWYESWTDKKSKFDFPFPCRIVVSANPGSGKTNLIKNILIRAKPYYKKIFVWHYDPESKEYEDMDVEMLKSIPNPTDPQFNSKRKTCLIIDDQEFKYLNQMELRHLDRLFGYTSTHKGLTIICATQDFFNLPPVIRRMSDVFCIWKGSSDVESLLQIGRKMGINKKDFVKIMEHCKSKFDFICFDNTVGSRSPVRKNCVEDINKISCEDIPMDTKGKGRSVKRKLPKAKIKPKVEENINSIYDIRLDVIHDILGDKVTYGDDLLKVSKKMVPKFIGVFAMDTIPSFKPGQSCICNTDLVSGTGHHWFALYKDGKTLWGYDPLGDSYNLKKKLKSVKWTDDDPEQEDYESDCGQRCIAWLIVTNKHGINKTKHI